MVVVKGTRRDEDDERPRKRRDEEEAEDRNERPRKAKSRDDEDDRPRKKGRDDDEDYGYQGRTKEDVRERATQQGGMYDSVILPQFQTYKVKEGDNRVRILQPTWANAKHYGFDIWIHRNVGPDDNTYICRKKMEMGACPICDEMAQMSEDDAASLKVTRQVAVWIIDRNDEDAGPKVWCMPWTLDRDIAAAASDASSGEVLLIDHPNEGYDVSFKRSGTSFKTKYFGVQIARRSSSILEDDDEQRKTIKYIKNSPIQSTLQYYDAEYIENVLSGKAKSKKTKDEVQDKDDDDLPPPKKKPRAEDDEDEPKPKKKPPVEDDEDESPSSKRVRLEKDEDEEQPKKKKPPVDEDEDDGGGRARLKEMAEKANKLNKKPVDEDDAPKPKKKKPPVEDEDE